MSAQPASRAARVIVACLLLAGPASTAVLTGGTASATTCGSATSSGISCGLTGSAAVSAGYLTLTSPTSLGWSSTLTGLDNHLVDTSAGALTVDDATGGAAGWHVTVAATTFTSGSHTLANTGSLVTNGSTSSVTATTAPAAACSAGSTCTLPTDTTSYPVAITTAASPSAYTIYDTSASTGVGTLQIGGSSPMGWWVTVPANTKSGSYSSTFTVEIISAP